jgi:hypothetical protein
VVPAVLLAAAAAGAEARADVVVLVASRDATLIEEPAGALANGSGPGIFAGRINRSSESVRRALVAFDVASAVPPGSAVTAASLTLSLSSTSGGPSNVRLHRVLAGWGEGASAASGGGGAPAGPGDATWIHAFFDRVFWTAPGGDFDPVPAASAVVDQPGAYAWGPEPAMTAAVQGWLDDPLSNHGWILIGDETSPQTVKRFDSRESGDPATRPALTVEFDRPCAPRPVGPGHWRRQCLGGPPPAEPAFAEKVLPCAEALLDELGLGGGDPCGAVAGDPPRECAESALRGLATLVFNVCADRIQPSCPVAARAGGCASEDVGGLLREAASLILRGDCRRAHACAASAAAGGGPEQNLP